jgi:hypothetical protein
LIWASNRFCKKAGCGVRFSCVFGLNEAAGAAVEERSR